MFFKSSGINDLQNELVVANHYLFYNSGPNVIYFVVGRIIVYRSTYLHKAYGASWQSRPLIALWVQKAHEKRKLERQFGQGTPAQYQALVGRNRARYCLSAGVEMRG